MARIATVLTLIVIITSCIGCGSNGYTGARASVITATSYDLSDVSEIDLVENLAQNRTEYQASLEILEDYYARTGNSRKLAWSRKELSSFTRIPQYNYVQDVIPGPELKARMGDPEATALFLDAQQNQRDSGLIPFVGVPMPYAKSSNLLRLALDQYTRLIKRYPASDKIDDAAFQAGYIQEHFKEYDIALIYYQRAYQWDSMTPHPARFRAAYLLDNHLHRKAEALQMYQDAMPLEGVRYFKWQEYAVKRIQVLTGTASSVR
jgi:tetratricopeptide (TPR) repeat protein